MKTILLSLFFIINVSLFSQSFNGGGGAINDNSTICTDVSVSGVGLMDENNGLAQICIDINHTYTGDLTITIIAPNGAVYVLSSANGGGGDNYTNTCFTLTSATSVTSGSAPFTGTFLPEDSWAVQNNGTVNGDGTWQLCVADNAAGDVGTLNNWSITFGPQPPPPAPTEEDCLGAIPICQDVYYNPSGTYGQGTYQNEINVGTSECLVSEFGGNWYTFTPETDGILNYTITPDNIATVETDYDWVLFDLTNAACSDLTTGDPYNYMLSANAAGNDGSIPAINQGATGISTANAVGGAANCVGPGTGGWNTFNEDVNVVAGNTYVLYVAQFDGGQGYTIDFSDSGSDLYDDTPPVFESVDLPIPCGTTQLTFHFNENILCSTVDDADFYLTGPGGTYTLSNITSALCSGGAEYDNYLTADVSPAIMANGTYTIGLNPNASGSVSDVCGNTALAMTFDFDVSTIELSSTHVDVDCYGDTDGSISVNLSVTGTPNYTYTWSDNTTDGPTSSTSSSLSNLGAGTYMVTVTDNMNCQDIDTITIVEPLEMTLALSQNGTTCGSSNGSITSTVTNGVSNFNYSGIGPTNFSSTTGTPYIASNLAAGSYTVSLTDQSGCTASETITVTDGGSVSASFTQSINQCLTGNSFTFDASGSTVVGSSPTYTWDFGDSSTGTGESVTHTFATSGPFTISLDLADGSCTSSITSNINVYPQPTATVNADNHISCNGLSDGQATAGGGNSYVWSTIPVQNTAIATGLAAGTYTVTVTDVNTCTSTIDIEITEPPLLDIQVAVADAVCNGESTGIANCIISTESTPDYNYDWSTGAFTHGTSNVSDQISIGAGTYSVTVTDDNGCSVNENFTIGEPAVWDVSYLVTDATCGNATGAIDLTINAGNTSPYTYLWASSEVTEDLNNILAGAYTVTITDATTQCDTTIGIAVSDAGAPVIVIDNSLNPNCNAATNGAVAASLTTTSTADYTYIWTSQTGTPIGIPSGASSLTASSVSGVGAGTVQVQVTDANGCTASAQIILNEPTPVVVVLDSIHNANCGQSDGDIYISATGGTIALDYTYSWNTIPVQNTQNALGVPTGTYNVIVTDDSLCTGTLTGTIVGDNPGLQVTGSIITHPLCNGDCNAIGQVTIFTPSTAPYNFVWDNGLPNNIGTDLLIDTVSGLCSVNTYSVTVTDANGCTAISSIKSMDPPLLVANATSTNINCFGGSNGTATVSVQGGTPVYTYLWNGGINPNIDAVTGLVEGTYIATVTDANLCTDTALVTLTQPTELEISIASYTDETCSADNGDITTTTTGGTTAYTYLWSNSETTSDLMNLTGGVTYYVTVTDANSCTAIANQYIDTIPEGVATITSYTNITCNGFNDGTATVSLVGGTANFNYVWSNGFIENGSASVSSTVTGLPQGAISVDVTDANNCVITASTSISEPAQLANNIVVDTLECNSYCDASIQTNTTGGTGAYTYTWDNVPVSTSANLSSLCAGIYNVTVDDGNNCTINNAITIIDPLAMVLNAVSVNSSCNQSDGSIDLTVTNPFGTITYYWEEGSNLGVPFSTNEDLTNIAAGNYFVTVTNGNNCTVIGNWSVIDDSAPIAVISDSADVVCYNDNNGLATVSVTGGTGAGTYTYLWNNGEITASITGLSGGAYTVSVTDANNCQVTADVTLYEPPLLDFTLNTFNPTCNGYNDGWASVTAFGGTPNYTYSWTGTGSNNTDSLFTNLADGSCTIQIIDANGCDTILNNIQIVEPTLMSAISAVTDLTCFDANNGEIDLTVIGGTPSVGGYTYIWDANASGQTTNPAVGLGGGTFEVTVYDDNNCEMIYSATVSEPTQMIIDSLIPTHLSCFQSGDGEINVHVIGGTPAYNFYWESGSNSGSQYSNIEDLSSLDSDTYFLTVTDDNGCTVDTSIIINQPLELTLNLSVIDESCYNYCDGAVNAAVTGGTQVAGSYNFLWSNNDATQNLINACPNTYTLQVTDANNCTISATETINGSPQLFISVLNITDATCGSNNGEITIGIGGGTGFSTINWNPIINNANIQNPGNSHVIDLPSGNHYISIEDANGCQVDTTLPLNNIGGPILDNIVIVDATCFGDCDGSVSVYYSQPVTAAPPYTLTWSGYPAYTNNNTLDNRCEGTYYWQVSDVNGCIISGSGFVGSPTELTTAFISSNNVTCNSICNGDATVNVNGGSAPYLYIWTDGINNSATGLNLCAGIHNVSVTDDHGCSSQSNVSITQPSVLSIDSISGSDVTCNGLSDGVVCVQGYGGSGSYYYQWYGLGANSITSCVSGLSVGNTYTVSLTDQNDINCSVTAEYVVIQPEILELTTSSVATHCNEANGQASIETITGGTAPYSINWSPCVSNCDNMILMGLNNSTYQPQITDANGCTATAQVQVQDKPVPIVFSTNSIDASCNGANNGCASLVVKYGELPYSYDWVPYGGSNSDSSTCNLVAGTYYVTVQDFDHCEVTAVFTIDEPDPIVVLVDGPSTPVCIDQATNVTVTANGGTPQYTYFWNDTTLQGQNVTVYPHQSSSYSVYVEDANGCVSNTSQVTIQVFPPIHVSITPDQTICYGENATITASASGGNGGSYSYNWTPTTGSTNPQISVSPVVTTTYTVWADDLCHSPSDTAQSVITVAYAPDVLAIKGGEGCEPLDVDFGVTLADTTLNVAYNWHFGDAGSSGSTESNPSHEYINEGLYNVSLTLTSINGCILDTVVDALAKVYPIPSAAFVSDKQVVSIFNSEIEFTDNSDGYGYVLSNLWDFGDSTIVQGGTRVIHRYEYPGLFNVMLYVTNQYGCRDSVGGLVKVEQEHTFYMPNAFRPHIDKYYYPKGIGIEATNFKFTIYDRWGEPIYESNELPEGHNQVDRLGLVEGGWNGKYLNVGKYVQSGVYVWLVQLEDINGYLHEYSGIVNVIR